MKNVVEIPNRPEGGNKRKPLTHMASASLALLCLLLITFITFQVSVLATSSIYHTVTVNLTGDELELILGPEGWIHLDKNMQDEVKVRQGKLFQMTLSDFLGEFIKDKEIAEILDRDIFLGWFTDSEMQTPFDETRPVVRDLELWAGWR